MAQPNGLLAMSVLLYFTFALLFLIGLGSPYWVTTTWEFRDQLGFNVNGLGPGSQSNWVGLHYGLWKVCGQTRICVYWVNFGEMTGALRATQVIMCLGFFSMIAGSVFYIWWFLRPYRPAARRLAVFFCILTGFLTLISICVFGNQFDNAMSLVGWGFWNTVICSIGLLVNGFLSLCLLSVCPIIEKTDEIAVNLDPIKKRPDQDAIVKKPSPHDGSENPAYAATPSGAATFTPSNPRDSKLSYAESLNDSIGGSSVIGFGMLGQPAVSPVNPPTLSDRDSIGPVDSSSRGYYLSETKPSEPKRPPPVAPKPSAPQYHTSQNPQYMYSSSGTRPQQPTYSTPVYRTQTSTPHSESDV